MRLSGGVDGADAVCLGVACLDVVELDVDVVGLKLRWFRCRIHLNRSFVVFFRR